MDPSQSYTYKIVFRYRKFRRDLKADAFESELVVTVHEPIPEPLQRHWVTIIRELNPEYFNIEIVDVCEITE
ncbi:hypothetical protein WBG78_19110 [Chryseolinea sp. T2]|uniref:hypothetical protein n=1 Tax=Chryseolinea sp. T2 TaxID=3129255 RepID=UPI0030773734